MKVERVSYDVPTPSAARGILEAIYWKPAIRWRIERIHVLAPIRFTNIRRNELASKIPLRNVQRAMQDQTSPLGTYIEEDRQQRAAMVLEDVDYVIEAAFDITDRAGTVEKNGVPDPHDREPGKHYEIFMRRAEAGQCFNQPYFGTREFPASFDWIDKDAILPSPIKEDRDLGWMLHDIDFRNDMEPRFFHAYMRHGVIEVPSFESKEVRK
jgi:CRISPR-associated protein Cas5d